MARRGQLALQRQLQRELRHLVWLEQHMPQSAQLKHCRRRILRLRSQLAVMMGAAVAM